ncbi:MAG TPA: winged helix DNA-binding protein, partial [Caulobacteraceae bacterium]
RVLALAAMRPGVSAAEISQMSGVDKSPVSRAVQALIGRGLMQAKGDSGDNRRMLLSLTAPGEALHDRVIQVSLERDEQILNGLSAAERVTLFQLFGRLAANLAVAEAAPGVQSGRRDPI